MGSSGSGCGWRERIMRRMLISLGLMQSDFKNAEHGLGRTGYHCMASHGPATKAITRRGAIQLGLRALLGVASANCNGNAYYVLCQQCTP